MDRPSLRYGYLTAVLVAAVVAAAAGGCRSAMFTASYLLKGNNVEAEYDGLEEKKVVVVCRPLVDLTYRDSNVAKDLAKEISLLLRDRVPDVEVVDHRKVAEWLDENFEWTEYTEVGEALEADMVVAIDLEDFTLYQGQTLYQGKANAALQVYDCTDPGQPVFEKVLPQTLYPPNTGIPTAERPEAEFRREFVRIMADQIGRHFYAHDAHSDYALDATAMD